MPESQPSDLTQDEPVAAARPSGMDRSGKIGIVLVVLLVVMELIVVVLYAREGFDVSLLWPNP